MLKRQLNFSVKKLEVRQELAYYFAVKKKHLTAHLLCSILTHGGHMEEFVERSYLFDFYGELLTQHQRRIYEEVVFEDLSLAEAAAEEGISRQGIHDIIKRCNASLIEYEQKLHLVERFLSIKKDAAKIKELAAEAGQREIALLAEKISEEL